MPKKSLFFLTCLLMSTFLLSGCSPIRPFGQDAEFKLGEIYYQKGLFLAEEDKKNAILFFQKSLDIFTKLDNEEGKQKVRMALDIEFNIAKRNYQKGLLIANKDKKNAILILKNSLDVFTELGNEQWRQKARMALDSTR